MILIDDVLETIAKDNHIQFQKDDEGLFIKFKENHLTIDGSDDKHIQFNMVIFLLKNGIPLHPQIKKVFKDTEGLGSEYLNTLNDVIMDSLDEDMNFNDIAKQIFDNYAKVSFLLKKSFVRQFRDENNNLIYQKNYNWLKSFLKHEYAQNLFFDYGCLYDEDKKQMDLINFKVNRDNPLNKPKNLAKPK